MSNTQSGRGLYSRTFPQANSYQSLLPKQRNIQNAIYQRETEISWVQLWSFLSGIGTGEWYYTTYRFVSCCCTIVFEYTYFSGSK